MSDEKPGSAMPKNDTPAAKPSLGTQSVSGPPSPPPQSMPPQWSQPPPPPPLPAAGRITPWPAPTKTKPVAAASLSVVVLLLTAASLFNIASQSSAASIAGLLAIAFSAAAIAVRQKQCGQLTRSSLAMLSLAIGAGAITVLRSALVVTIPTWLLIVSLLVSASINVTFRPATNQFGALGTLFEDMFRAPGWLTRSAESWTNRFGGTTSIVPWVRGFVLAVVITVPVVLLLASADAAFESVVTPDGLDFGRFVSHSVLTSIFVAPVAGLLISSGRHAEGASGESPTTESLSKPRRFPVELSVVLAGLIAALAAWGIVQLAVAFGGADAIFEGSEVTRADHAREGFFQLVAVASIVICVLATCGHFFRKTTNSSSKAARLGALLLAVETTALTVITFSRLNLYIQAYGLTATRLAVAWFLVFLGLTLLVFAARIASGLAMLRSSQVARFETSRFPVVRSLLCGVIILFGLSNPDHMVASINLERSTEIVQFDRSYLLRLSSDATPIILANEDRFSSTSRERVNAGARDFNAYCRSKRDQQSEYGFLGWNYGLSAARNSAEEHGCLGRN